MISNPAPDPKNYPKIRIRDSENPDPEQHCQMTATVFRQSDVTQRPSLFTLISYCAIVFSFALMFANGWFTACDDFYGASAYWLSHMKQ